MGYDDSGFFFDGTWYKTKEEMEKAKFHVKVNWADPKPNPWCECGAKFDRECPQGHSRWCPVYKPVMGD